MGLFDKRGKAMDTTSIVIIALIVVIGFGTGAFDRFLGTGQTTAAPIGDGGATIVSGAACPVEDTTVTLSAVDKFDASVLVNGNHQYKINGAPATTVANGGTFTASPGDVLKILWGQGNNSGTHVYLNSFTTEKIPCVGTKTFSTGLYRNGTITSRIFNEEGNLIDDALENETLAAGDVVNLNVELQGQFERGQFANGGCALAEYNNSAYDDVIYNIGGSKISTPAYQTVTATANVIKTYTVPAFTSATKLTGSVTIDVDNSNGPSDSGGDILFTFVPNEWRLNPDSNEFQLFTCGEDQDGNRVANPVDSQADTLHIDD